MTGFGRGTADIENLHAAVELAGVNRKQAEVVVQGLRELGDLEDRVRKAVLARISRGRVQVSVTLEPGGDGASGVAIDHALARRLDAAFGELSSSLGRDVRPSAADFLRVPGIVKLDELGLDPGDIWRALEPALDAALAGLQEMRAAEGRHLVEDLEQRLQTLESLRTAIGELAPERPVRYREALIKRLGESGLDLDLDDDRVLREVGVFADRCDVTEELTRLDSHFARFRDYLAGSEAVGRPLDFLCQELNREFNTIGSKASDAAIAQHVVTAKTELEKIREQVQNLE